MISERLEAIIGGIAFGIIILVFILDWLNLLSGVVSCCLFIPLVICAGLYLICSAIFNWRTGRRRKWMEKYFGQNIARIGEVLLGIVSLGVAFMFFMKFIGKLFGF